MMFYGVKYQNPLNQMRTKVLEANTIELAKMKYENNINNRMYKLENITKLSLDKCILLYQSERDIIDSKEFTPEFTIVNGIRIIKLKNIGFGINEINFEIDDLHFTNNTIEMMVCIHDGRPNWLY